jgi:hypothetical protein
MIKSYLISIRKIDPVEYKSALCVTRDLIGKKTVKLNDEIYFFKHKRNIDLFLGDSATYLKCSTPPRFIAPSIMVIGRGKSGKTMIAKRIGEQLNLVYLTVPQILQNVLDLEGETELAKSVSFSFFTN